MMIVKSLGRDDN